MGSLHRMLGAAPAAAAARVGRSSGLNVPAAASGGTGNIRQSRLFYDHGFQPHHHRSCCLHRQALYSRASVSRGALAWADGCRRKPGKRSCTPIRISKPPTSTKPCAMQLSSLTTKPSSCGPPSLPSEISDRHAAFAGSGNLAWRPGARCRSCRRFGAATCDRRRDHVESQTRSANGHHRRPRLSASARDVRCERAKPDPVSQRQLVGG